MLPGREAGKQRHLVVGHVCLDELADGRVRLGGTAYFGAVQAARLGCQVTVETACTRATLDRVRSATGPSVAFHASDSSTDTRFGFGDDAEPGPDRLLSQAPAIALMDFDGGYDSVHIAPIAGEVTLELFQAVRPAVAFVGVTPQGLLRAFPAGAVREQPSPDLSFLALVDAAVVNRSEYDHLMQTRPDVVKASSAALFVTRGASGASLFQAGEEVARYAPRASDSAPRWRAIGAGDVFAATAFVTLARGVALDDALAEAVESASAFVARPQPPDAGAATTG
jgi:sugar/nucleoside kinase (ribokinase family)